MLFSPLGITQFEWVGSLAGVPSAASGLRLRPRDLAKFGSLYLHDGQWNTRQVVTVLSGRYNDFSQGPPQRLLLDFILPALPTVPAARRPARLPSCDGRSRRLGARATRQRGAHRAGAASIWL